MVLNYKAIAFLLAFTITVGIGAQTDSQNKIIKDLLSDLKQKSEKNADLAAYFSAYKDAMVQKNYTLALDKLDKAISKAGDVMVLYELRGSLKSMLGDYTGAIADYDKVIAASPNFVSYYNRGTTKTDGADLRGALADYNKSITLEPNYARLYNNRGTVKLALKDSIGAAADFRKSLSLEPGNRAVSENLNLAAKVSGNLFGTGSEIKKDALVEINDADDLKEKLKVYDAFLKMHPNSSEVYFYRAEVRKNLNDYKGAIADYSIVISYKPAEFEAFFLRANLQYEMGNYNNAIEDFSTVIRLKSNYPAAYNNRGLTYLTMKSNSNAKADFTKAIELDPDFSAAYVNRGRLAETSEDFEDALADYEKALSQNTKNETLKAKVEALKVKIAKRREEVNFYSQYISYKPNESKPYYDRGLAYKQLREFGAAVSDFTTAIRLDSTFALAYNARAEVRNALKDTDGMIADYQSYLRFKPDDTDAMLKLAVALESADKLPASLNYFNKLIQIRPNDAVLFLQRGIVYEKSKNYTNAIADYSKYIALRPGDWDIQLNLAIVKRKNKDYAGSVAVLDKIIGANANNADAYYERAKVNAGYLSKREAACEDWKKAMDLGHAAARIMWTDECKK